MAQWQTCNVLKATGSRQLWQFAAAGGDYKLERDYTPAAEEPLPRNVVAKKWGALFRPKLNVAWLPPGAAFLRVLQLPPCEPDELLSMVEFQLEKLSPLPVAQIVWAVEALPKTAEGQQTVIVIIAARQQVENFLGQIESEGFLADRLETPALDHLLAAEAKTDGVWVYPPQEGTDSGWLVAWWIGGVLRHLGLIYLPDTDNRAAVLKEQIQQMAWAGELEGWLTAPPRWHLVADSVSAALWEPALRELAGESVQVLPPYPLNRLAALTARRAARGAPAGLLPADYAVRYRARYVDGLWMSGITAVVSVYLLGVLAYFGFLKVLEFELGRAQSRVNSHAAAYTNALQLTAQIKLLQDQQTFKYAALDCWEAVAKTLPAELTLTSMSFGRERTLSLFGTAPQEGGQAILDFNAALKQTQLNGQPLFAKVNAPFMGSRQGNSVTWNFTCELNRLETE